MKAAGYLENCTPTRTLMDKTPLEMWYGHHSDVSHLRKLGYKVWVHIHSENPKIYNWSIECLLVSYSDNSKAYRCLDQSSGHIHTTHNTFFI